MLLKRFIKYLLIFSLLNICHFADNFTFKIHFLYVGEADCTVIEYEKDEGLFLWVVDCGENISYRKKTDVVDYIQKIVCPYLLKLFPKVNKEVLKKVHCDIILTHPHFDHYWNLGYVIDYFKQFNFNGIYYSNLYDDYEKINYIDRFLNTISYDKRVRNIINKQEIKDKMQQIFTTMPYIFYDKNITIEVLWPEENYKKTNNDFNDNSMVLLITVCGKKILLMADAGVSAEQKIIEKYRNTDTLNNIEIIKIGHHGYDSSSSENLVNIFNNLKYIINSTGPHVLTCGCCNLHQKEDIIDRWKKKCDNVLTTEINGDIVLFYNNSNNNFELKEKKEQDETKKIK